MNGSMLVLNPTATSHNEPQELSPTLDSLAGKVVGFIDNSKPNFSYLVDDLAEILTSKYGVSATIKRRKHAASIPVANPVMQELTERCDLIITGSGD